MRMIFAFVVLLCPSAALALSCVMPDVARSYQIAAESHHAYVMAHGEFAPNPVFLRETSRERFYRYRFTGMGLTRKGGYNVPMNVWVEVSLTKPDPTIAAQGGHVDTGRDVLVFLRSKGRKYFMESTDCDAFQFYDPTPTELSIVHDCFSGFPCEPEDGF